MKTPRLIPAFVLALGLSIAVVGCNKQERTSATNTAKDAYKDSVASMGKGWDNVKSFSYEKRDDFRASAKALSSTMDSKIQEVRANYSEAKASASRKAAMSELKDSESNYKAKLDALGQATAATWDSAKQNVISAWDRMEAAYHKARAD